MLENHVKYTGSDVAENMLNNWSEEVKNFVKVIPNDYKKVITVLDEELEKGTDRDEAMLIAFENVTGKKVENSVISLIYRSDLYSPNGNSYRKDLKSWENQQDF